MYFPISNPIGLLQCSFSEVYGNTITRDRQVFYNEELSKRFSSLDKVITGPNVLGRPTGINKEVSGVNEFDKICKLLAIQQHRHTQTLRSKDNLYSLEPKHVVKEVVHKPVFKPSISLPTITSHKSPYSTGQFRPSSYKSAPLYSRHSEHMTVHPPPYFGSKFHNLSDEIKNDFIKQYSKLPHQIQFEFDSSVLTESGKRYNYKGSQLLKAVRKSLRQYEAFVRSCKEMLTKVNPRLLKEVGIDMQTIQRYHDERNYDALLDIKQEIDRIRTKEMVSEISTHIMGIVDSMAQNSKLKRESLNPNSEITYREAIINELQQSKRGNKMIQRIIENFFPQISNVPPTTMTMIITALEIGSVGAKSALSVTSSRINRSRFQSEKELQRRGKASAQAETDETPILGRSAL